MNTIDTIYLTGDLIAEKCCGCKEALPIIIQQTKETCCYDHPEMLAWIICGAVVAVALIVIAGWLIRHKMDCRSKVLEAENKRKEQERERLIKLKQDYQARVLEEFISYKKICEHVEDEKRKLEIIEKEKNGKDNPDSKNSLSVSEVIQQIEKLLAEDGEEGSICDKIKKYIQETKEKKEEIQKENRVEAIFKRIENDQSVISNAKYIEKLNGYLEQLDGNISKLNTELGIRKVEDKNG